MALLVERVEIGAASLSVRPRINDAFLSCARDVNASHGEGSVTHAAPSPETLIVHVPFRIVKRGGLKEIQLPTDAPQHRETDNTLIKALARAFRWKRILDSGWFATLADLATHERIAPAYMTCVLQLTLLALDIVEVIRDGH